MNLRRPVSRRVAITVSRAALSLSIIFPASVTTTVSGATSRGRLEVRLSSWICAYEFRLYLPDSPAVHFRFSAAAWPWL